MSIKYVNFIINKIQFSSLDSPASSNNNGACEISCGGEAICRGSCDNLIPRCNDGECTLTCTGGTLTPVSGSGPGSDGSRLKRQTQSGCAEISMMWEKFNSSASKAFENGVGGVDEATGYLNQIKSK